MDRPAPFMVVIVNHVGLRASPAATVVCLGCLSGGHEKSCVSRHILWRCHTQNNHVRYTPCFRHTQPAIIDVPTWEIPRRFFPYKGQVVLRSRLKSRMV